MASVPIPQDARDNYQTMHSQLGSIIRRAPVTVPPSTSVHAALEVMERHHIGSIIVADSDTRIPLGIFTLLDLLRRIALQRGDMDQPITNVMTSALVSLPSHATAYDAALIMARRRLRHVVVVDDAARLVGIVSQNDLFALQRVGVKEISNDIGSAHNLDSLVRSAADIRLLADNMLAQGIAAEQITHFISTLNDLLTVRLIELTCAEFDLPQVQWCWIALGSEGRFEQTFSSDQDNGLVFDAPDDIAEELRQRLLPFAQAVNRKLDACGFLLCKGNIMAGNPTWCLTLQEWQHNFSQWIATPSPQSLLNAAIFFDFRAIYGASVLTVRLRQWLMDACSRNSLFLYHMAREALQHRPPLGVVRDFVLKKSAEFPRTIDLKMYGAWPFVTAARIYALRYGVEETSTAQRLRLAMAKSGKFSDADVAAMLSGFYFIQSLRLRHQHRLQGKASGANRINPYTLNEFERRILKEAFRQAKKLQRRLRLDYQL